MTDYRSSDRYVGSAQPPTGPHPSVTEEVKPKGIARMLGFFDSATKIIGTLTALIVAIGGAWFAIQHFGSGDAPAAGVSGVVQVQQCETAHDMTQAHQKVDDGAVALAFGTCQWPPARFSDPDGFSLITVTPDQPGPGTAEYTSDTDIDIFTGTNCHFFRLRYEFKKQGSGDHPVPVTVAGGTAQWMGQPGVVYTKDLGFGVPVPPDADQAYFVRNASETVSDAVCVG
jgi:hypothetical protein